MGVAGSNRKDEAQVDRAAVRSALIPHLNKVEQAIKNLQLDLEALARHLTRDKPEPGTAARVAACALSAAVVGQALMGMLIDALSREQERLEGR